MNSAKAQQLAAPIAGTFRTESAGDELSIRSSDRQSIVANNKRGFLQWINFSD
jgi:hypothetical protein